MILLHKTPFKGNGELGNFAPTEFKPPKERHNCLYTLYILNRDEIEARFRDNHGTKQPRYILLILADALRKKYNKLTKVTICC